VRQRIRSVRLDSPCEIPWASVNCPSCNAPLFGTKVCGCGYKYRSSLSPIDLSYVEAMVAFWRIYWPAQLFGIAAYLPTMFSFQVSGNTYMLNTGGLSATAQFLLQAGSSAVGLFLFTHRFLSSPFRTFSVQLLSASAIQTNKLNLRQRVKISSFLWWRQIVAGFAAAILAGPLNILLSLIGLRAVLGINIGFWISILATVLAAGPIILKMLIGHEFKDFRFEVTR